MNTLDTITPADPLDPELRALDVAVGVLDDVARDRKTALLASLVSAPVALSTHVAPANLAGRRDPGRRRRPRAWWLIPAAAATVVGLLVLPGGVAPKAYASWTPTPGAVSAADLKLAADACQARLVEMSKPEEFPADQTPMVKPETAKVIIADRRGAYVFVALRTDTDSTIECLSAADSPAAVTSAGAGLTTRATSAPSLLTATQLDASGGAMASGPEGSLISAIGRVGSGVRAVTIRSEGRAVQATVSDGYFAAWWPTTSLGKTEPILDPIVTYDVTLSDGQVLTDVDPGRTGRQVLPGPRQIGTVIQGGGLDGSQAVATVAGRAGAEVKTVRIQAGDKITDAPVVDGVFTAKWNVASVESAPSSDAYRYTLTLTDGTVLTDVTPVGR